MVLNIKSGRKNKINKNQDLIKVNESSAGIRVDKFLAKELKSYSRAKIQKLIKIGAVLLNNNIVKSREILSTGDVITIDFSLDKFESKLTPYPIKLNILYEDDYLIVINKQAGLVVHPGAGDTGPTLVEGLLYYFQTLSNRDDPIRPGIVHRLDKDTSGVIVCAKNDAVHESLALQFKNKTNYREYIALIDGVLANDVITYESYIKRDPSSRVRFISIEKKDFDNKSTIKYAKSHFKSLKIFSSWLSLVSVRLETGRTHQIRVHAKALGTPIVGDSLYNNSPRILPDNFDADFKEKYSQVPRQLLHAKYLGFTHPIFEKKLAFKASLPEDFAEILDLLEKYKD